MTKAVLDKAVLDLRQGARRAALETVNLMLASGQALSEADRKKIAILSADLPPTLVAAILDPASDANKVKAMANSSLSSVAAYFDGGRTLADRLAAAQPVAAGTSAPRADLPYHTALEQSIGDKFRAAAEAEIGRDPFGKVVLSRLNAGGKSDPPPIVIEDQSGPVAAQYDFRRRAVVLDREGVLSAVVGAAPPPQRAALRQSLATRAALFAYLDAHPEAVAAVVRDNDVLIVHEYTHAWQDRRDPIFQEIARGNLPDTQPLEYEEEATKTKNLYIHSKLKNAPASVKPDSEFADYIAMTRNRESWKQALLSDLNDASPSRALPFGSIHDIQMDRLAQTKSRAVVTNADQQAKALDLKALSRSRDELDGLKNAHAARMAALDADIEKITPEHFKVLASYYLVQAASAERSTDRAAALDQAERYANASGDADLIENARRAKEEKK